MPIVFAVQLDSELNGTVDAWTRLKHDDGTMDELYDHWILGKQATTGSPRWSIIRDVLSWVD